MVTRERLRASLAVGGALASIAACGGGEEFSSRDDGTGGGAGSGVAGAGGMAGAAGSAGGGLAGAGGGTAGTGTAGSGTAGSGTADAAVDVGPACRDADMDGVTDCDGDCDDGDPNSYPGNFETCGDLADNDCSGKADDGCMGLGTFVSSGAGSDSNPGTVDEPVQTINQGMANAQTIGNGQAVFVAQGHYSEKIVMVESVSLLGGYDCAAVPCSWARDPLTFDSAINNTDFVGIEFPSNITRQTRLDGFRVIGLDGDPGNNNGSLTMLIDQGSPTISNNRILGARNDGSGWQRGRQQTIGIQAPINAPGPLIIGSEIAGGESVGESCTTINFLGGGPGTSPAVAEIRNNIIRGGEGRGVNTIALFNTGPGTIVQNNDIFSGESDVNGGASWAISVGDDALIDGNRINVDQLQAGRCNQNPSDWCGGIVSFMSKAVVTNNVVFGIQAPKSAAFMVRDGDAPNQGSPIVQNNVLDGGGVPSSGGNATISTAVGLTPDLGLVVISGKFHNNILLGGVAQMPFGFYEDANPSDSTKVAHPEELGHNNFWLGGVSSTGGALYRYRTGSGPTLLTNPMMINTHPTLTATNNFSVDCLLDATFHLSTSPPSPCLNAADSARAPATDFEGDARPLGAGVDVGADEAQ